MMINLRMRLLSTCLETFTMQSNSSFLRAQRLPSLDDVPFRQRRPTKAMFFQVETLITQGKEKYSVIFCNLFRLASTFFF